MTTFSFDLSFEDTQRLFTIKHLQGFDNLYGNEFAQRLLEKELTDFFQLFQIKMRMDIY